MIQVPKEQSGKIKAVAEQLNVLVASMFKEKVIEVLPDFFFFF